MRPHNCNDENETVGTGRAAVCGTPVIAGPNDSRRQDVARSRSLIRGGMRLLDTQRPSRRVELQETRSKGRSYSVLIDRSLHSLSAVAPHTATTRRRQSVCISRSRLSCRCHHYAGWVAATARLSRL